MYIPKNVNGKLAAIAVCAYYKKYTLSHSLLVPIIFSQEVLHSDNL